MNKNLLETLEVLPFTDSLIKKTFHKTTSFFEGEIKNMEKSLAATTESVFSPDFDCFLIFFIIIFKSIIYKNVFGYLGDANVKMLIFMACLYGKRKTEEEQQVL